MATCSCQDSCTACGPSGNGCACPKGQCACQSCTNKANNVSLCCDCDGASECVCAKEGKACACGK
ncbi:hypothetical protein BV20DRAFT_954034 [Pilatotrama ljubarskyi]|nr:hypothetical protein BV20DRAFT_954034 [Pilatotrama ljubarskyi]